MLNANEKTCLKNDERKRNLNMKYEICKFFLYGLAIHKMDFTSIIDHLITSVKVTVT